MKKIMTMAVAALLSVSAFAQETFPDKFEGEHLRALVVIVTHTSSFTLQKARRSVR